MSTRTFSNLSGKILAASPYSMKNNIFHKSIIYVVHHSYQGSVGFLVNRLIEKPPVNNLFKNANFTIDLSILNLEVYVGGPLEIEKGFFLHSSDYNKNLLFKLEDSQLAVSSNIEILKDITSGEGPKHSIFAIGYTAWGPGQLEFEIRNNLWLVLELNHELIFSSEPSSKWSNALAKLNINDKNFIPYLVNC